MKSRPVTLHTINAQLGITYSHQGYFFWGLKGVIRLIHAEVDIIDLSNEIRSMGSGQASFILYIAYRYFSQGSSFCVVVEPGGGSDRKRFVSRLETICPSVRITGFFGRLPKRTAFEK